jgi:hypothetical protein
MTLPSRIRARAVRSAPRSDAPANGSIAEVLTPVSWAVRSPATPGVVAVEPVCFRVPATGVDSGDGDVLLAGLRVNRVGAE